MVTVKRARYRTIILFLVWGCGLCPGAELALEDSQYWARTWQTDDGLPRNTINCLAQTPDGYLWLGTPFGVIRFDGVTFTRMERDFHPGFTRARSRVLYTDAQGRLWIGTGTAGIIRYDGTAFTVIDAGKGLPHPTVSAICEDTRGTIWIGFQNGQIAWVDATDRVHPIAAETGPRGEGAVQLVRDRQGVLWFAQVNAYGQLLESLATNVVVSPNQPVVLCPSRDGGMWVLAGTGLKKISGPNSSQPDRAFPTPVRPNQLSVLFEDHQGDLWLGSQREGVFRYSGGKFIREFSTNHRILAILEDSERNLWIGTEGGGVSRLQRRVFHSLAAREGLPQTVLRSVCESSDGDIWLSGQGPLLMKWRPERGLETVPGFTNIGTTCMLPNPAGGVWVGTVDWGLFAVDSTGLNQVGNRAPFRNRQIRALHQDARGQLWIGCLPAGLAKLANGRLTGPQKFFEQGLPTEAIWTLADDAEGNLWLGTITGTLWRYDGTNFTALRAADGLPDASIGALHFTREGDLWVGTLGGGLGRWRDGKFSFADVRHGLADDVISGIVEDHLGWFWLSTDHGIIRVRKKDLDEFADGKRTRFDSIWFGKDDGLANLECIGGYQPAVWHTRSNHLWFATSKGAVWVDPAAIPTDPPSALPVLEKVLLDNREITNRHELKIAYGYAKLDFQFTAPSFTAPEQVQFRHQLVGLETNWMEDGMTRRASYPRLAPGQYEFRCTARNRSGEWSERVVSMPFEVTPTYWQTAWFRGACLLFFGSLVAVVVRYRYVQKMRHKVRKLEQARAVEQERMRIARDIHDDLGARLTQMAFLTELAAGEVGEGKTGERLIRLADSSREAIRSLDEIVWAVNPRKDSLPSFVDYLSHLANEFFRESPIRFRQELPLLIPDVPLPTDLRHHLFLACKEALTNASKHAGATEVQLRLHIAAATLEIVIADNGRGFRPEPATAPGNGLANQRSRLAMIGGQCEVESAPGRGTRVRLSISMPPPHNPESSNVHQSNFNRG
jgi:ligand-binding sensor domain-containing protein/signal transduction histidine kinase